MSSSNNLCYPEIDTTIQLKGNLKKHMHYYSLLNQICDLILKIPEIQKMKIHNSNTIELELVLIVCNLIENAISPNNKKKLNIDKQQLCVDIFIKIFNLTPLDIITLQNQIQYLYNNKMIKRISFLIKAFRVIKSYFF